MESNELLQKIEKLEQDMEALKASRGLRAFMRRAFSKSSFIIGIVVAAALTGFLAWAAQNTFVDDTVISADAVNNNFNELYAAKWGKNGSDLYYNDGNVGIGTDTPGAKLDVNGDLEAGQLKAQGLFILMKDGVHYNATPQDCINLCASNGGRIATVEEVYIYAAGKNDHCGFLWFLDTSLGSGLKYAAVGYPMYHNQTGGGCGTTGTGDIPRVEGYSGTHLWTDASTYDCACHGVK